MNYIKIKLYLDFVVSFILLIVLLPIFLLTIILIFLFMGKPIFFIQPRLGKNKKVFKIIKFRTLDNISKSQIEYKNDDRRVTKLGSFLRKTSLDELPNLYNIIKGDMSFIGPRPLLVRYKDGFNPYFDLRHTVKPGITGFAQIKGRTNISWRNRFRYDVFYSKNISLRLDFYIFLRTVKYLILLEGYKKNEVKFTKPFV
tara:strand:+ start:23 stop:619 length:597 start_codon:yes stop_codon:yes gene_type:complete